MNLVFFPLSCALVGLVFQILIWRVWRPRRQGLGILILFHLIFYAGLFFAPAGGTALTLAEFLEQQLFFSALVLCYLLSFPAIEAESPTSLILFSIAGSPSGISSEELLKVIRDDVFFYDRIAALEAGGYIRRNAGLIALTPKGILFERFFGFYKNLVHRGHRGA